MGQKTHPIGFRLGIVQNWHSRWFANNGANYSSLIKQDIQIRQFITSFYKDDGISKIEIERTADEIIVTLRTSRPGVVIGRSGKRIEELDRELKRLTGAKIKINTHEIRVPELDATQVAQSVAYQLENRAAFRRTMRNAVQRTMNADAKGIKMVLSGRLGGAEIARSEKQLQGSVPLHTLRAWVEYALAEAHTTYGVIGVKVWIYRGDLDPKTQMNTTLEPSSSRGGGHSEGGSKRGPGRAPDGGERKRNMSDGGERKRNMPEGGAPKRNAPEGGERKRNVKEDKGAEAA